MLNSVNIVRRRGKSSGNWRAALALLCVAAFGGTAHAQQINWNTYYQRIDGFGASDAQEANPGGFYLTSQQAGLLFSTTNGVGLSLLRSWVPDDGSCDPNYDGNNWMADCAWGAQVSNMQMAQARGARVWAAPWSPPAYMKYPANVVGGVLTDYNGYAQYLSNFITSIENQGVSLYALSVQNEPDNLPSWDSCWWSGQNIHDFIAYYLGPTMRANGQSSVKLMLHEADWGNSDFYSLGDPTLTDPTAAQYVGIFAFHDYNTYGTNTGTEPNAVNDGIPMWETEVADTNPFDPSMTDALNYVQQIHNWLVGGNVSAWHYWNLVAVNYNNQGLIYPDGTVKLLLYAIGNYSKFVRPNWYRIDTNANPQDGVYVTAFKNPSNGQFAIVAINQNSGARSQSFSFNGLSACTVTPWVTATGSKLVAQAAVSAGSGFTYTLPALSVTTFVGTAGGGGGALSAGSASGVTLRSDFVGGYIGTEVVPSQSGTATAIGYYCSAGDTTSHNMYFQQGSSSSGTVPVACNGSAGWVFANLSFNIGASIPLNIWAVGSTGQGGSAFYDGAVPVTFSGGTVNGSVYLYQGQVDIDMNGGYSYGPVNFQWTTGGGRRVVYPGKRPPVSGPQSEPRG